MRLAIPIFVAILVSAFLSGCVQKEQNTNTHVDSIVSKCVSLCQNARNNTNLSNGPCLSNNIAPGWVCDVAHWPRQPVDNNPENQCPAYGKTAHAFVEVDPNCRPIREYNGRDMKLFNAV